MFRFCFESILRASPEDVYAFHARPDALSLLLPPWPPARVLERKGGLEAGAFTVIRMGYEPFGCNWTAVHTECIPNVLFTDEQQRGPFRYWRHRHLFIRQEDGGCLLRDEVTCALPFGLDWLVRPLLQWQLNQMFIRRHAVTARHVETPFREASCSGV
ncbi:MAG TPA: SRPBCC family protein [Bryobacteraceae bacterium]|nr:SRPBCC family protein [Bryobacteraceae bacterium]